MFLSILHQAYRGIMRLRAFTAINIVGLMLCLSGVIVIARYVAQECTVDHYLPDLDRTFIVCNLEESGRYYPTDAENINRREGFPDIAADSLIEVSTRFYFLNEPVTVNNQVRKLNIVASDTAFFDIFPRKLVMGSDQLGDYQKVIVTSDIARELWPDEHPIGMKLRISPFEDVFEVAAVVDRPLTKAHFDFDIAMGLNDNQDIGRMGIMACRLIEGGKYSDFNKRSQPYIEDFGDGYTHYWHFQLVPLAELYFDKNMETDIYLRLSGNKNGVYLLIAVGVALLVVGLFNFINIYGVVMTQRRRNFGIRKAFGAKEGNFFIQIFLENLIISAVSVAVAWVIVATVSPTLSKVFDVTQNSSIAFDIVITIAMLLIFPLVVSLATSFSLWRSARVHSMDNADSASSVTIRRYLLLMPQMAITISLIIISLYFMAQLRHVLNSDLGYRTHDIAAVEMEPTNTSTVLYKHFNTDDELNAYRVGLYRHIDNRQKENQLMAEKLKNLPYIEETAMIDSEDKCYLGSPAYLIDHLTGISTAAPNATQHNLDIIYMDRSRMKIYGFELVEGEVFDEEVYFSDRKAIITESAKLQLGINDISIDKLILSQSIILSSDIDNDTKVHSIVGVIKDVKLRNLAEKERPVVFIGEGNNPASNSKMLIRYKPGYRDEMVKQFIQIFKEINGDEYTPEFEFIEDAIAERYADDYRTASFYVTFAVIAIIISCLGLFGVISYDLKRRYRELAIRRTLGASAADILQLICRPYAVALVIASGIASAISIYVVHAYQADYFDHLPLSPWYFIGAIAFVCLVSYITIASQVYKIIRQKQFSQSCSYSI